MDGGSSIPAKRRDDVAVYSPATPRALGASHNTMAAPPWTEIIFVFPSAKNPIHFPSGEKNGSRPFSVPGSNEVLVWSSNRVASICLPS
jgi:hypothetical protein